MIAFVRLVTARRQGLSALTSFCSKRTRNNFIVSLFTDTVLRESTIEFSSCLQNQLTAVPIWITPDEYLKYLEYIAESELPDDDPGDDSDTGNRA